MRPRRPLALISIAALTCSALLASSSASASLTPGDEICFATASSVHNVTPVDATAPGWGRLVPRSLLPEAPTSNVNFLPRSVDPNVAIGVGNLVCYETGSAGPSDVVIDEVALLTGPIVATGAAPTRVADTRVGSGGGRVAAAERRCFAVPGPPGALAFVNLTPVGAAAPGSGQLVSSDTTTRPTASNVNFAPGTVDPNVGAAVIGADGAVCFLNSVHGAVDLVADHMMTLAPGAFTPTATGAPTRIVDTRTGLGGRSLAPSERRCVTVEGPPGQLATVNLTVVNATAPGFGRLESSDPSVAPAGSAEISHVNFGPGTVDPNVAFATIGVDGRVCFVNSPHATIDLVADHLVSVAGIASANRVVDTRSPVIASSDCQIGTTWCVATSGLGPEGRGANVVLRSTDGGRTWRHTSLTIAAGASLGSVACDHSQCTVRGTTFGTGLNPPQEFAYTSTDGWLTWMPVAPAGASHGRRR